MKRILFALVVATSCAVQGQEPPLTEFPTTLEPVVHVERMHFLGLRPVPNTDPVLRAIWAHVEQCAGVQRDITEVQFYVAIQIFLEEIDPTTGRKHMETVWGVYYPEPPEIVITPTDVPSDAFLAHIVQHEIAHHFAGVIGDEYADHHSPLFLKCSGEAPEAP